MKLTESQKTILGIAKEHQGVFYPHPKHWYKGEFVYISGSGFASSLRSLLDRGLVKQVDPLSPYWVELTEAGQTAAKELAACHSRKCREKLSEVRRKQGELVDLTGQLDMSICIKQVWPEAFEHGSVSARRVKHEAMKPSTLRLVLSDGAGTVRDFSLWDLPEPLRSFHLDQLLDQKRISRLGRLKYTQYRERYDERKEEEDGER